MKRAITLACQPAAETVLPSLNQPPRAVMGLYLLPIASSTHHAHARTARVPTCEPAPSKVASLYGTGLEPQDATRTQQMICRKDFANAPVTWVLCLHQNAQQHLPRLEKRKMILSGAAFHAPLTPAKQSLLSIIICSSPRVG